MWSALEKVGRALAGSGIDAYLQLLSRSMTVPPGIRAFQTGQSHWTVSLGEHFKITTYFKFDIVAHQKRLISTDSFLGKPLDKNVQNQTGQIEIWSTN